MQSADRPASRPSRPSQPLVPAGAAPKLVIEKFADGGVACIKFAGTIDESFEGKKLGMTAAADTLVLDLGGVKKISSWPSSANISAIRRGAPSPAMKSWIWPAAASRSAVTRTSRSSAENPQSR